MDRDIFKERVAALLRVIQTTKIVKQDNLPCKIEEGLYLGSLGAANNRNALKSLNITHVLTVATLVSLDYHSDFIHKTIEVRDTVNETISKYFDECFAFIEEARTAGGGALVHCFAGRSRSVTVVVAYLMFKNGMSLSEALEHVRSKRPVASPNPGFILQLQDYEKSLQDSPVQG